LPSNNSGAHAAGTTPWHWPSTLRNVPTMVTSWPRRQSIAPLGTCIGRFVGQLVDTIALLRILRQPGA